MLMSDFLTIPTTLLGIYAFVMMVFLVMENRRPQSTLAWMLVLFFAPGIGLLIYLFFGRDTKAGAAELSFRADTRNRVKSNLMFSLLKAPARRP